MFAGPVNQFRGVIVELDYVIAWRDERQFSGSHWLPRFE